MTRNEPVPQPAPELELDTAQVTAEDAEKILGPLLRDGDGPVSVAFRCAGEVSNEYIETLFGTLMRSAIALGGRRLAIEWMNRLRVQDRAEERAHRTMAKTVDLDLRFGMLSPPLAAQAGCRADLLEHEQHDANCIARLAVRGIATDGEVRKMRQRLVKRIVKAVSQDTESQTVGTHRHDGRQREAPDSKKTDRRTAK